MNAEHVVAGRRAVAERSADAILDGAERLVRSGRVPAFSAVAAEAGVSRPTVYAHFADRTQLMTALLRRAAERATAAIRSAEPDRGAPDAALRRVLAASWEEFASHQDVAHNVGPDLSVEVMHGIHLEARAVLVRLLRRGRRDGVFRSDLPGDWLVTSCMALMHAAAACARRGEMDATSALDALECSVVDLWRSLPRQGGARDAGDDTGDPGADNGDDDAAPER